MQWPGNHLLESGEIIVNDTVLHGAWGHPLDMLMKVSLLNSATPSAGPAGVQRGEAGVLTVFEPTGLAFRSASVQ
jgi:hypothetical protein